jgi:hypothetical protein
MVGEAVGIAVGETVGVVVGERLGIVGAVVGIRRQVVVNVKSEAYWEAPLA